MFCVFFFFCPIPHRQYERDERAKSGLPSAANTGHTDSVFYAVQFSAEVISRSVRFQRRNQRFPVDIMLFLLLFFFYYFTRTFNSIFNAYVLLLQDYKTRFPVVYSTAGAVSWHRHRSSPERRPSNPFSFRCR